MVKIIEGNLFDTKADIICHQCNCQGVMGSGVAAEVKKRYPEVFKAYREDFEEGKLVLGYVNFAEAKTGQIIANLCGQEKYGYDGKQYTHYEELQECFHKVVAYAEKLEKRPVIAFPYLMSCHRGGGDWNVVSKMIEDTFQEFDVEIRRLKAE
ncbi:MAG: macro domain-containing protein [Lachnospiraceae bacterium]|nr:macro domain-containing protein [Lachnospiraceae bacterium]MBQ7777222.1 macro domain-containing protein [Lachnospiraceae bacterium]